MGLTGTFEFKRAYASENMSFDQTRKEAKS